MLLAVVRDRLLPVAREEGAPFPLSRLHSPPPIFICLFFNYYFYFIVWFFFFYPNTRHGIKKGQC